MWMIVSVLIHRRECNKELMALKLFRYFLYKEECFVVSTKNGEKINNKNKHLKISVKTSLSVCSSEHLLGCVCVFMCIYAGRNIPGWQPIISAPCWEVRALLSSSDRPHLHMCQTNEGNKLTQPAVVGKLSSELIKLVISLCNSEQTETVRLHSHLHLCLNASLPTMFPSRCCWHVLTQPTG